MQTQPKKAPSAERASFRVLTGRELRWSSWEESDGCGGWEGNEVEVLVKFLRGFVDGVESRAWMWQYSGDLRLERI